MDNKFYLAYHANLHDSEDNYYYVFEHNIQLLKKTLKEKEKAQKDAHNKSNNTKQPRQPKFRMPKGSKGAKI